jgi:hypothetical protein
MIGFKIYGNQKGKYNQKKRVGKMDNKYKVNTSMYAHCPTCMSFKKEKQRRMTEDRRKEGLSNFLFLIGIDKIGFYFYTHAWVWVCSGPSIYSSRFLLALVDRKIPFSLLLLSES